MQAYYITSDYADHGTIYADNADEALTFALRAMGFDVIVSEEGPILRMDDKLIWPCSEEGSGFAAHEVPVTGGRAPSCVDAHPSWFGIRSRPRHRRQA